MKTRSRVRKWQIVLKLAFPEFKLALHDIDELRRVLAENFGNGHFNRAIVSDDDDATGDGDFAGGESIKSVHQFFGGDAAWSFDFDFDFFSGEIVEALDFDLALA